MSKLQNLLSRLQKVKQTGKDSWIACCPAHADRSPSFTVRELPDGRILAHCFAGCSIEDAVEAAGLTLSDLMPDDPTWQKKSPERITFNPRDVLAMIDRDLTIAVMYLSDMAKGKVYEGSEKDGLIALISRLKLSIELGGME